LGFGLGVFWDVEVGSALGFGAWSLGFDIKLPPD
jgi:hypothetical protein